jgi:hypothetical protein
MTIGRDIYLDAHRPQPNCKACPRPYERGVPAPPRGSPRRLGIERRLREAQPQRPDQQNALSFGAR